jgi:prepilin-type N-terminal cleavage/methylation domain-containing protein
MILASSKNRRGHLRGFTLIELLVVIAIIGILSAVVLAALNTARSKGNDAAIKSDLDSIRTESAIYYDNNGNAYGTNASAVTGGGLAACTTGTQPLLTMFAADSSVKAALTAISPIQGTINCNMAISGATWMIYVPLTNNATGNNGWCIDSTGKSEASPTEASSVLACP